MRPLLSLPLVLVLAVLTHVDWHIARPHHLRLSLDWDYHWLLGVLVFGWAARYVRRRWPTQLWEASALNLALAALGAQIVEPVAEGLYYFHRWTPPTDPLRWTAFAQFFAAGLLAYLGVMAALERRDRRAAAVSIP
jgi:hypothetical protein